MSDSRWIPVSEKMPDAFGAYLISSKHGTVYVARYTAYGWSGHFEKCITAWMPLPEPYHEEVDK